MPTIEAIVLYPEDVFLECLFDPFLHLLLPPSLNLCPKNGLCTLIEMCGAMTVGIDGGSCIIGNRFGSCHVHGRDIMSLICATVSAGIELTSAVYTAYVLDALESVIVVMIQAPKPIL